MTPNSMTPMERVVKLERIRELVERIRRCACMSGRCTDCTDALSEIDRTSAALIIQ